jgi:DNA modification methylase
MKEKNNPNKLPFLQAQILQQIFVDIYNGKQTTLNELSILTDYPLDSKILQDAIVSLKLKGFLLGEFDNFSIPEEHTDLMNSFIKHNDLKHKVYSNNLKEFCKNGFTKNTLFNYSHSISELNKLGIVHKWYDYLEDFPYQLIEEKIKEYKLESGSLIVEPFAGSGTTLISANLFNCNSIGFDSNPLMTYISSVKTTWNINLKTFINIVGDIAEQFVSKINNYDELELNKGFLEYMPKKELNQWLSPSLQVEVIVLKNLINQVRDKDIQNLFLLAMSKSCFDASYVSLCPGTTFYPFREKEEFWDIFTKKIIQIYHDLEQIQQYNSYGTSKLINDTCLNASKYIDKDSIHFIITSPPYPNDLEYTRQTRLELYLLDFVKNMNDVQKIKRNMVKGSTKLVFKESNSEKYIEKYDSIKNISDLIYEQTKSKNWGFDYPRMVREYFGDMYLCMKEFYPLLKSKANFLLVVGDQTTKGVYNPVCDILLEMAKDIGYVNCHKELFRIRRSTGHNIELPEEIVIIQKP